LRRGARFEVLFVTQFSARDASNRAKEFYLPSLARMLVYSWVILFLYVPAPGYSSRQQTLRSLLAFSVDVRLVTTRNRQLTANVYRRVCNSSF
jgi:hypothetical protein